MGSAGYWKSSGSVTGCDTRLSGLPVSGSVGVGDLHEFGSCHIAVRCHGRAPQYHVTAVRGDHGAMAVWHRGTMAAWRHIATVRQYPAILLRFTARRYGCAIRCATAFIRSELFVFLASFYFWPFLFRSGLLFFGAVLLLLVPSPNLYTWSPDAGPRKD